ncbi:MAG: hypothetical protein HY907_09360 [Deltaproteobacteria bacterium]|nr:hypothetical protein [Deltaproteobacteria bacterium]
MKRVLWFACVVLATAMAGCSGRGPNAQSPFPECTMPEGGSYTGRWATNMGDMELSQDGNTVVGTWKDVEWHKSGHIEGTVRGCLLLFSWTQIDERIPNVPRETTGHGVLQYIIDPPVGTGLPVHRFDGTWGHDRDMQGGGAWTGRKRRGG